MIKTSILFKKSLQQ